MAFNFATNSCTSFQETDSTGQSGPQFENSDGFSPITACHCPCVTSYFPIQNDDWRRTRVRICSSAYARSLSDPIKNCPAGILTNVIPMLLVHSSKLSAAPEPATVPSGASGAQASQAPPAIANAAANAKDAATPGIPPP